LFLPDVRAVISYDPQKALLVDKPPAGKRWIHELKLDGYRMGVAVHGKSVRIFSRRGNEYTDAYPEVAQAVRSLGLRDALIDGEVVVVDESGLTRFERLQRLGRDRSGLTYFAFDLLWLDGEDLRRLPLVERKARLRKVLRGSPPVLRFSEHFEEDGAAVFVNACRLGAEGIVSKLRDGAYQVGARAPDWQKTKCIKRQEFVVGGFTDPDGSRTGVGSILVGFYERDRLRFAGKVGNGPGWNAAFGESLRARLDRIESDDSPFDPPPPGWLRKNAHWVKPKLVVEVAFTEWTSGGNVRHPSLQGFRIDKSPREVVKEVAVAVRPVAVAGSKPRLVYPRVKLTTDDLEALYASIMDWALPHVASRPLTLVRMKTPITRADALRSQATFAHHTARDQRFVPDVVPKMSISEKKKIGEYRYVDSPAAFLALLRSGVVEWHVWNARIENAERPDRIVFDLDPGEGTAWASVVQAARRLRGLLEDRDLESWVKTTGGNGLHVVVPFRTEHDWHTVFDFSRDIARALAKEEPAKYLVDFGRAERAGKVLIDYKRNYRTSIAVAGFSLRARPEATIAVPVKWEELSKIRSDQWTATNIGARVRRLKTDPWEGYWESRQRLSP
jgi:bifunctional non-homologous end joining protein LigD